MITSAEVAGNTSSPCDKRGPSLSQSPNLVSTGVDHSSGFDYTPPLLWTRPKRWASVREDADVRRPIQAPAEEVVLQDNGISVRHGASVSRLLILAWRMIG